MTESSSAERVLFIHAHPDDESLSTGGTIATLIDAGADVTLLTLTRGERGEVVPTDLAHLSDDPRGLGRHRVDELANALGVLGIRDSRFLGDERARLAGRKPREYHDSGMVWVGTENPDTDITKATVASAPHEVDEESLLAADYGELVTDVATVVADVKPTAIISYNADGGYGHPDHVLAHDAASHAAEVLGVPYYAIVDPATASETAVRVNISPVFARKRDAIAAHRSQLTLEGDTVVHSGGQRHEIGVVEAFERVRFTGQPAAGQPAVGLPTKTLGLVLAAVSGAVVGALGTVNHQFGLIAGGESIPVGVFASLLLVAVLLVGLRLVSRGRIPVLSAGIPLIVIVALMATLSPGGSVLVPDNFAGATWAYGVPILFAIIVGWPRIERPATATPR